MSNQISKPRDAISPLRLALAVKTTSLYGHKISLTEVSQNLYRRWDARFCLQDYNLPTASFLFSNSWLVVNNLYILLDGCVYYRGIFWRVGRVKIQEISENINRHRALNRLIRDLLSNMFLFERSGHSHSGGLRRVQIWWNICASFARYLYSTEWSLLWMTLVLIDFDLLKLIWTMIRNWWLT